MSVVPSPSVELTPARPVDADAIAQLLKRSGLPADDFIPHLSHFIVARKDKTIIGSAGLEIYRPAALLRSLAVAEEWRGTGVGSQLLGQIENYAVKFDVAAAYLLTTTAEGFFAKRGYRRIARDAAPACIVETGEFRGLCPVTAALMVRNFGGHMQAPK